MRSLVQLGGFQRRDDATRPFLQLEQVLFRAACAQRVGDPGKGWLGEHEAARGARSPAADTLGDR